VGQEGRIRFGRERTHWRTSSGGAMALEVVMCVYLLAHGIARGQARLSKLTLVGLHVASEFRVRPTSEERPLNGPASPALPFG
jgi:hypothetical protein